MSIAYHCSHLSTPHTPHPPSHPSSSFSTFSLDRLYFCEECDALRCDQCALAEVANYYCPNCLFDVPSANVKADKNRCARSCFNCPQCWTFLAVQANDSAAGSSSAVDTPASHVLACPGCRWTSRSIGWEFEKATGIALQLQKMEKQTASALSEYDAIKDHLSDYITANAPLKTPARPARSNATRHISHLTQMAAKALNRPLPSKYGSTPRVRTISGLSSGSDKSAPRDKSGWDELVEYPAKRSWRSVPQIEEEGVRLSRLDSAQGCNAQASLDSTWSLSQLPSRSAGNTRPQCVQLQTKLTKRCPHPNCRHLLIQPDTKSVRMKIKMVARSYLPEIEIGRRRRRTTSGDYGMTGNLSQDELERRRRERRRTRAPTKEEDQDLDEPILAGAVYTYQLAFVNPLYDPIQIRLTPASQARASHTNVQVHVPTPHFTVDAMRDAWAYDEPEEEDDPFANFAEGSTEVGSQSEDSRGTAGKRSRMSMTATGVLRDRERRHREGAVEKKGNVSKVGIEVEVLPQATGAIEFDLEVRYTYRAEEAPTVSESGRAEVSAGKEGKEAYKTFTFWVRVGLGDIGEQQDHA